MKKKLLMLAAAAMFFASCGKGNENHPTPSPDDDGVRITNMYLVYVNSQGDTSMTADETYIWENGLLKEIHSATDLGYDELIETTKQFVYDGDKCVEAIETDGSYTINSTLTYADGRLKSISVTRAGSPSELMEVTGYTADGHISAMNYEYIGVRKQSHTITWENGDAVAYTTHPVDPAGDDQTVDNLTYDNYPSVYTGCPMVEIMVDDIATHSSKHNLVKSNAQHEYKNGRLVKIVKDRETIVYTYSDGTTGREN